MTIEYTDPHLMALLRRGSGAEHPLVRPDEPARDAIDPNDEALLGGTISLFDGACEVEITGSSGSQSAAGSAEFHPDRVCYVSDTKIATSDGVIAARDLVAGDVVLTSSGDRTVKGVHMVGSASGGLTRTEASAPVYLRRHALAPGLPGRDVWLSPTQCVAVENRLVPAGSLINGTTFAGDIANGSVRYCQVQYDAPAIGRPAVSPDELAPIRRRLAERAVALGYGGSPHGPVAADLYLLVDGKPLLPVEVLESRWIFVVPAVHTALCLGAPTDMKIVSIDLSGRDEFHVIPADHPGLQRGWGPAARDGDMIWRPVIGMAHVSAGPIMSGAKVVVHPRAD